MKTEGSPSYVSGLAAFVSGPCDAISNMSLNIGDCMARIDLCTRNKVTLYFPLHAAASTMFPSESQSVGCCSPGIALRVEGPAPIETVSDALIA